MPRARKIDQRDFEPTPKPAKDETDISHARRTLLAMIRVMPELHQKDGEKESAHWLRVRKFVSKRWGCSVSSIRAFTGPMNPPRRRPTITRNPGFFADLKEFGGARFRKADGALIEGTLGKGPDPSTFLWETPAGSDARGKHRT